MKKWLALVPVLLVTLGIYWWLSGAPDAGAAGGPTMPKPVVNVMQPRATELFQSVQAVGTTEARAAINVAAEVDGRLDAMHFIPGKKVEKGALLVSLDDRTARADLAAAEAALSNARQARDRARRLEQELLSRAEMDTLESALKAAQAQVDRARALLDDHRIRAPFAGVPGLRRVNPGSYVRAGDVITTLDDLDTLEVVFSVPERFIGSLETGQTVEVFSDAWPDRRFLARVEHLDSRVDPATRMIRVKASLDNRDRALRPGQFLSVSLQTRKYQALMVPEQAVLTLGSQSFVYVVDEQGHSARRDLVTGARREGWVEVREGLTGKEQVVINGNARLAVGVPVEIRDDPEALQPAIRDAFLDLTES